MQLGIDTLLDHKLLLVTGKGGIGKTVVATALAMRAAALGKRVCLVECSDDDQIAPLLGRPSVGHKLTKYSDNLYFINLDHKLNFRDFVIKHLGFEQLFERIFSQAIVKSFVEMIPGLAEITLLGRLYYSAQLAKDPAFDLVVFDGFASGHFLSLMHTPDVVLASGLVGPVIKETQRVRDFLASPQSATVMVGAAEALVVSEVKDFLPLLQRQSPTPLKALLINRVPQNPTPGLLASKIGQNIDERTNHWLLNLASQAREQLSALGPTVAGLRGSDKDFVFAALPELGWVHEPLTDNFAGQLFADADGERRS